MSKALAFVTAFILAGSLVVGAAESKKSGEVDLQGVIGCSQCTYGVANKCGVSFKTADGKIYTLEQPSPALMKARHDGGTLKVTGTVIEKDGKLFVKASKAELVP